MTTYEKGFTLIELMITVAIVAIIAAIAIPSYRSYIIRNAETEVQKEMLSLSVELQQWRAKALSYKGFEPKPPPDSAPGTSIIDSNGLINYPLTNPKYTIKLGEMVNNQFKILNHADYNDSEKTLDAIGISGLSWIMVATPKESANLTGAKSFMLTSSGVKCARVDTSNRVLAVTDQDCGSESEPW